MLRQLFKKRKSLAKCFVLNCFNKDFLNKKDIVEFHYNYFKKNSVPQYKLDFFFSYDEFYKDYNGKTLEKILKTPQKKWDELLGIIMCSELDIDNYKEIKIIMNFDSDKEIIIITREHIQYDFFHFCIELNKIFPFSYGYAYKTYLDLYAPDYADAIDKTYKNKIINVQRNSTEYIRRWYYNNVKASEGFFRDIYEYNILIESHLNRKVGIVTIKELIKNKNLGELKQIVNGIYFWHMNSLELENARNALYPFEIFV